MQAKRYAVVASLQPRHLSHLKIPLSRTLYLTVYRVFIRRLVDVRPEDSLEVGEVRGGETSCEPMSSKGSKIL